MLINFSLISENLANTYGDGEALVNVERNRRYTFRQLHRVTNQIINMLHTRLNLRKGDVILTILNNDNVSLLSFFTACKSDVIFCYANIAEKIESLAHQIALTTPKVVFVESSIIATHLSLFEGMTVVTMDEPPPGYPNILSFWQLMENVSDENPNITLDDRKDCVILRFTGGTTGPSKAVMYSIDNWIANKDAHLALLDAKLDTQTRCLHFGLISHASGMLVMPIIFRGGCTLTMNDRSLNTWCKTVSKEKVTDAMMVPTMLYHLLDSPEAQQADLSTLRAFYYGGSTIDHNRLQDLQQRFGNIFIQIYAASEHSGAATLMNISEHLPKANGSLAHLATAGKIVPGCELKICDQHGNTLPIGSDGEIWIRSRGICLGYWNNPEKTAEEFCDGFWRSGDAGRIDKDGYVHILDRIKDRFSCSKSYVYPSQLEAIICTHPKVARAAVVGIPRDSNEFNSGQIDSSEEHVHAEIVPCPDVELCIEEITAFLADKINPAHLPKSIFIANEIPVSPVGKVLRRQVKENCLKRLGINNI